MILECIDEVRVDHDDGKRYLFEERDRFGYVYEVDEALGEMALATGKVVELTDYEGPTEIPSWGLG